MSYADLRKGRFSQTGQIYFVTTVLAQREWACFTDLYCARLLIREMRRLHEENWVSSLAWVVMPDHLHWLFQLQHDGLSKIMNLLKGRSANQINRYWQRQGHVWQTAYYDHALREEEDIQHMARYIVANPLRAGIVDKIGNYPHWDAVWLNPNYSHKCEPTG